MLGAFTGFSNEILEIILVADRIEIPAFGEKSYVIHTISCDSMFLVFILKFHTFIYRC